MPSKIDDASPVAGGLRERGKRRRSKQILDAARVLLRQAPDQELTVERIAARAELSPQTVYNLIGRREHIWGALADDALDALNLPRFAAIADPRDRGRASGHRHGLRRHAGVPPPTRPLGAERAVHRPRPDGGADRLFLTGG